MSGQILTTPRATALRHAPTTGQVELQRQLRGRCRRPPPPSAGQRVCATLATLPAPADTLQKIAAYNMEMKEKMGWGHHRSPYE